MDDLISRQAAIDAINISQMLYSGTWVKGLSMAADKLRDLPSVNPCNKCRFVFYEKPEQEEGDPE